MDTSQKAPDVLARPLAYALRKLEEAGWEGQGVRAGFASLAGRLRLRIAADRLV